jgi:hypothetical protein
VKEQCPVILWFLLFLFSFCLQLIEDNSNQGVRQKKISLRLNALKFHLKLKLLNFQNQKNNFPKNQVDEGYPPYVKFMPGVNPLHPPTV